MIVFPNAKINIGLFITQKRDDGFHNLETIFYPVSLCDALEIIQTEEERFDFSCTGLSIENSSENFCVKAYQLLKKSFPSLPTVQMHLHKTIPMGAGLGGGSADAAFTLQLLNNQFQLNISQSDLLKYALELGSDCPFFIYNKPCIAKGRGEILQEIKLDLSNYYLALINPGIHINTASAFRQLTPKELNFSLQEIANGPIDNWKTFLKNDFEESVFNQYPEIRSIKDSLYKNGALYASMSGSGSSVYGIFKENPASMKFNLNKNYFQFSTKL